MNLITLDSVEKLHNIFRCYPSHKGVVHLFRGQANTDWQLLPKAGRPEYYLPDNMDLNRFHDWESQAIAYGHRSTNVLVQSPVGCADDRRRIDRVANYHVK